MIYGKKLIEWTEALSAIDAPTFLKAKNPANLGIGTYGADLTVSEMKVRPVEGKVRSTRGARD